ncbi:MAG: nucleoside hydrolase [Planctomycetes bacterium]|nr:nucleoside hydrolase [Planctomycetota bacterium]
MNVVRVWIDTDCALGAERGDVDDAFAIAAVVRNPRVELLGVSTVFGNSSAAGAVRHVERLLTEAGVDGVPVLAGAQRAGGSSESVARRLVELPEETRVLALGPLTNLANAQKLDAQWSRRIGRIAVVGGRPASRGPVPPWWPHEFNLTKDLAAAQSCFEHWIQADLWTLDVVCGLRLGQRDLERIGAASALGAYLYEGSRRWLRRSRWLLRSGFALWDVPPALDLEEPRAAELAPAQVCLTARGCVRVRTAPESRWRVSRRLDAAAQLAALERALARPALAAVTSASR